MICTRPESDDPVSHEEYFRSLLPAMKTEDVEDLLATVAELEMELTEKPHTGLIMLTARDAFQEQFHLGEVLVSVAETSYDGIRGHATVMGDDTRRAMLAALINAVSRHPESGVLLTAFRAKMAEISQSIESSRAREAALMAATRVNFDSMAAEEM